MTLSYIKYLEKTPASREIYQNKKRAQYYKDPARFKIYSILAINNNTHATLYAPFQMTVKEAQKRIDEEKKPGILIHFLGLTSLDKYYGALGHIVIRIEEIQLIPYKGAQK